MGKQCQTLFLGGSKITTDGDCSHEIKRRLLIGRKVMTNLDSILKSRDITLPTKVRLVKAVVFPVVMYGCESWVIKKAEHRRIDAFKLWCWRRLSRVPWTARRSNQSILKEISSGCRVWCSLSSGGSLSTSPLLCGKDAVMNRNVLFDSKVLHEGRSLCGAGSTQGSSRWPFLGSHGGFVLIKMVLFTGGERLWHHPAKENPVKNKVEKR